MFFETEAPAPAAVRSIVPPHVRAAAIARAAAPIAPGTAPPIAAANDRSAPAAPIDHDQAAAELVEFATVAFFPLYPALEPIYTTEKRASISRALAPVLRKYNIDLNFLPPEIGLALVTIPLIAPTIAAVKAGNASIPKASTHEQSTQTKTSTAAAASIDVTKPIIETKPPPAGAGGDAFLARFPTFNGTVIQKP